MIRLSLLFLAAGVATLVFAQIEARPPAPKFEAGDVVGSWMADSPDKCGSGETPTLEVAADRQASIRTRAYSASGRLLPTAGIWLNLPERRSLTSLSLLDDEGRRWVLIFDSDQGLHVLEGAFDYRQDADGAFMVLPRLPRLFRCG